MRGPTEDPGMRVAPALLGAEAGPRQHLLGRRVATATRRANASFGVESPAHRAGAFEHRPRLVRNVRHHTHELVAGERRELLDADRLDKGELVGVVQPHRPQRDPNHRRSGLEKFEVCRLKPAAVVAHRADPRHHTLGLGDRNPHNVAWRQSENVPTDWFRKVILIGGFHLEHCSLVFDHAAEERGLTDGHRTDRGHRTASLYRESSHIAGRVEISEDHVRRFQVLAGDCEDRFCDLFLVRGSRHAHLEDV